MCIRDSYAILLKKEELVTDLLDKREWFSQTSMIDSRAMDYGIQTYQTNVMRENIDAALSLTKGENAARARLL